MYKYVIAAGVACLAIPATAQDAGPVQAVPVSEAPSYFLPANSEILLSMNEEVTTKGKRWNEGDTFNLSVVHDVMLDNMVVIPKGSRGVGRITWLTNKGMFGKSGKMDVELEYVEVGGRRIDISGTYRQEGEGNTVATVGGVVLAGPFAAFITGKSGRIPRGRELMAHTDSNIPVAMPANYQAAPVVVPIQAAAQASTEATSEAVVEEAESDDTTLQSNSAVKCETCD